VPFWAWLTLNYARFWLNYLMSIVAIWVQLYSILCQTELSCHLQFLTTVGVKGISHYILNWHPWRYKLLNICWLEYLCGSLTVFWTVILLGRPTCANRPAAIALFYERGCLWYRPSRSRPKMSRAHPSWIYQIVFCNKHRLQILISGVGYIVNKLN